LKGKYEKITNYNLSYENLLEAIAEFEGYITGVSNEDLLLFNNKNKDILSYGDRTSVKPETSQEKALNIFLKDISSRILDRTTGGYFINDLVNGRVHDAYFQHATNYFSILELLGGFAVNQDFQGPTGLGDFMHIIMPTGYQLPLDTSNSNIFTSCFRDNQHMNQAIKYYNTSQRLSKTEKTRSDGSTFYDDDGNPKLRYSLENNAFNELGNIEINSNSEGDRYKRPNLGAIVMRHPKVSIAGRNKSHLPIFFNAISAVEMSRCTPYIRLEVITQDFGTDGSKISNMNQVGFMRFSKGEGSDYKLDDTGGIFNTTPVNDKSEPTSDSKSSFSRYSYMDIFNSPQTMANANINKDNKNIFSLNHNNDDPVLEPIMPMMTLKSANISITGAGFGLMASKKGSIKLVLHDRSRMRDIAPLISSTQFTSTKIVVEFGWSHPDGGVNSDNVIGKYLNGLKDRSIFQVVGTNYSFGGGNSVSIDIDLAAYGYRQNEKIHCGSGPEVPLNIFEDLIKKVASDLSSKNSDGEFKETPEVRQLIKLNSRNARSVNASISWAAYDAIFSSINNSDNTDDFKAVVKAFLKKEKANKNEDINDEPQNKDLINQIQSAEKEVKDQVSRMLGKLKDIQKTEPIDDPFSGSTVTGSKVLSYSSGNNEKESYRTTTLGKVISHFVGHSIAASCLYDEVQLFFYPINHHAAGGRIHTTASFPIPIKKLEDEIDKKLNNNPSVSVNAFFSMLEKIVRDRNLDVYGLVDLYTDLNTLKSTSNDIVLLKMKEMHSKGELEKLNIGDDPIKQSILASSKDQNSFESFEKDILFGGVAKESFETSRTKNAEYKSEEARLTREMQTIEVNIDGLKREADELETAFNEAFNETDTEAINSITGRQSDIGFTLSEYEAQKTVKQGEIEANKKLIEGTNAVIDIGLKRKKAFDELVASVKELEYESTRGAVSERCAMLYRDDGLNKLYPAESKFVRPNIAMDFEVIDAISPPVDTAAKPWEFAKIYKMKNDTTNGLKDNKTILRIHIYDEEAVIDPASMAIHNAMIGEKSEKQIVKSYLGLDTDSLNFNDVKQIMKRSYPTIIYGSSGSVIKDISVSANTSGDLSKVLMVESYERVKDGQVKGHSYENEYESLITLPNTVSLGMMGQPMIGRGNNIFIDFGTNTSLDNIYTVKTVSHTLAKGDFSTTVQLVPSNIGSISTFKERMRKVISGL